MWKLSTIFTKRHTLWRVAMLIVPAPLKRRISRSVNPMEKWKMIDPKEMDDDLLDMIITHRGHRLDKATKGNWSLSKVNEGSQYKSQLAAALETCRLRNRTGDHVLWAERVLAKYQIRENDKNRKLEPVDIKEQGQENDIFSLISGRRSIRYFQPRDVEKEKIEKILEAGIWAPCSGNRQAWHFVVQRVGKEGKGSKSIKEPESYDFQPLPFGAVVVYVAIDERIYPWKYAAAMDAAAAIQNMLLMAYRLGLGACWYYGAERLNQDQLRARFGLTDNCYFYSTIQLGYPAEDPEAPGRKPLNEITTFVGF